MWWYHNVTAVGPERALRYGYGRLGCCVGVGHDVHARLAHTRVIYLGTMVLPRWTDVRVP